jgi:Holliday junction DNA helicase RuvA
MYEAIRGTLKEKTPTQTIVECAGIFYRLVTPLSTYARLPACEASVILFISLIIREDAHALYGFLVKEERDLFEVLLNISGIGPKTAAAIIGSMEVGAFQQAIARADIRLLSKVPGIGKKTAERLVIEMRDKFSGKGKSIPSIPALPGITNSLASDATNALIHLGYNAQDAYRAVQGAIGVTHNEEADLGRLIAAALRRI